MPHKPTIQLVPPQELVPYERNARTHNEKQIKQIANSIQRFGFLNPVLVDEANMIIAGHGRVRAAIDLQMKTIPIRKFSHLSEEEKLAYILADNKIAEKAGWDQDILAIELQHLLTLEDELDVTLTGFEMAEIEAIVIDGAIENDPADQNLPSPPQSPVTKKGDIWLLGDHKIICGDALDKNTYKTLLGEERASLIFTDPPYNVPISGHVCGNGKIKHKEFAMASGEMSRSEFVEFLEVCIHFLIKHSLDGSIHYICMDWRHMSELLEAADGQYKELKNLCVWNKSNGGMGSLYRSKHELIFVFKNGTGTHTNNVELGKNGRNRTNIWDYPSVNSFGQSQKDLTLHPTVNALADGFLKAGRGV